MKTKLKAAYFKWPAALLLVLVLAGLTAANAGAAGWVTTTVDSAGIVGGYSSIFRSNSGLHISYYDSTNHALKYATKSDYLTNVTGTWNISTVDNSANVGMASSIAVDGNGKVYISYYDVTNGKIKLADTATGGWTINEIATVGANYINASTSIVLPPTFNYTSGYAYISFYDITNGDLKCATVQFLNGFAQPASIAVVDSTGDVGRYNSMTMDKNGKLHISYFDATNGDLKYATNGTGSWLTYTIDSAGVVGLYTSIKTDSNGNVHISYLDTGASAGDKRLKYITNASGSWAPITIDNSFSGETVHDGEYTSIALDDNNKPHISYYDWDYGALRHATNATQYGYWGWEWVDLQGTLPGSGVGQFTSIVSLGNGEFGISYFDATNGDLKYAYYDKTPPDVPLISPWTTNVPVNSVVKVFFSEIINPASIDATTLNVKDSGGNSVAGSFSFSASEDTGTILYGSLPAVIFTPTSNLASFMTYTVTVTTGVYDWAANHLPATVTGTFTTAAVPVYTVSASAGANGSISPSSRSVTSGNSTTFTVTPNTGYHAAIMGGTCGGTLNGSTYTTDTITADCTVTVSFAINTYTVTPSAGTHGIILPTTAQSVNYGSTTTFTIMPEFGYHIETVAGCGGLLSGQTYTTGAITTSCAVTASFAADPLNGVCGTANGQTFTTAPSTNLCADGTATAVTGTGPWTWSCTGLNGGTTASCSANIQTYTVTPTAGANGSISPNTAQTVNYNGTKAFTITAANGYAIQSVTGCGGSMTNANTYTTGAITANCTVTASFTNSPVNGACGTANGQTLTTAPSMNLCASGTPGTVSGTGPWNWSCTGANGGTTASCSANLQTYTVAPSAGAGGTISPNTAQTVNYNGTKAFTVTPNTGYHISATGGTCGGTLSGNTYTTAAITANCTVTASFAINTYTVTPSAGAGGSISPNTAQTVNYNGTKAFTVTPNANYHIASVTGCGGTLSGNTYTTGAITANCTVTATFGSDTSMVPTGDLNGDGMVDATDALKALRIAAGIDTSTAADLSKGDVAPLVSGTPHPDGKIDIGDVVVILRKAVGLISW